MEIKEGDIIQQGLHFYRVYTTTKRDIVVNKILYNFKTERLQIFHDYEYIDWNDVGEGKKYNLLDCEEESTLEKFEWVKRKFKLQKLNKLSEEE
jgi:hypothetical protein